MQIAFIVALIFAIAVAIFAVQNTTPVAVSFLWFQVQQVAVSILILICTLLGATLMILVGVGRELRRALALRSLRQQLAAQEQLVRELQAQLEQNAAPVPITEDVPAPTPTDPPSDVSTISQTPPAR